MNIYWCCEKGTEWEGLYVIADNPNFAKHMYMSEISAKRPYMMHRAMLIKKNVDEKEQILDAGNIILPRYGLSYFMDSEVG